MLAAALFSGSAQAQTWIEYNDPVWGFSINFPHQPVIEDIEYTSYYQRQVPARVFSGETDVGGRYVMNVVVYAGDPADSLSAVWQASEPIRERGTVTYFDFHDLDGIPGLVISVTEPDGRLVQASIYYVNDRLYIIDGSVPAGNPPPSNFWQSVSLLDPVGNRIILDDDLIFP
jgi:hypothetical protein